MNRRLRRTIAVEMRKESSEWPAHLVEIPPDKWPVRPEGFTEYPFGVWRSRHYLAMLYRVEPHEGVEVRRLTVNRAAMRADGHWEEDIPWVDLMRCKRETGHGDWYAVEVYPRDRDIQNIANMRHLWMLARPLGIGWFT